MLTVDVGAAVNAVIDGHSATNGAPIPADATLALSSSNPAVATVPPTATSSGGTQVIVPVTVVGPGSATISVLITTADGATFPASDSLVATAPVAALTHATLTLVQA